LATSWTISNTRFRTKLFLAALATATVSLLVAAPLISWQVRERQRREIQDRLVNESLLIAELLSQSTVTGVDRLDAEADRLGQFVEGRVTFIAADGRVVGDSTQTMQELATLENHANRPEIVAARESGRGVASRYSTTVDTDMLYVAVRAQHPGVAFVRLALPLTDVDEQLAAIRRLMLLAFAAAVPVAFAAAWVFSHPIARRVKAIADVAKRYQQGEVTHPPYDYGSDELGAVARLLDSSVQELQRRLEELSRDRARMEAILAGMVEGVLVVDRQGKLQLVNDAARVMLKVEAQSLGRGYLEVIRHPDIGAQLATALGGQGTDSRELALARDPARTFVARAAPVASEGGGGAVLVLHDITDLRRADQIRRDFVANVSHELRTPLTAIRGYVEAIQDDPSDASNTRKFLEIVARQTRQMERLVKDLLRLARLDARQEPLDIKPCDVRQLFTAVVADLTPSIESKRQHVTTDVAADAGIVHADAVKLHDILRNLVENAVNYSPPETEILLSAHCDHGAMRIDVADSGPGIPPEDLGRVFERFYRVDKSRTRPGTGLGLAIVKHLVELHGGETRASNRPEGGAAFTVTIPASSRG